MEEQRRVYAISLRGARAKMCLNGDHTFVYKENVCGYEDEWSDTTVELHIEKRGRWKTSVGGEKLELSISSSHRVRSTYEECVDDDRKVVERLACNPAHGELWCFRGSLLSKCATFGPLISKGWTPKNHHQWPPQSRAVAILSLMVLVKFLPKDVVICHALPWILTFPIPDRYQVQEHPLKLVRLGCAMCHKDLKVSSFATDQRVCLSCSHSDAAHLPSRSVERQSMSPQASRDMDTLETNRQTVEPFDWSKFRLTSLLKGSEQSFGMLEDALARHRANGTLTSTPEGCDLLDTLGQELLETGNGLGAIQIYRLCLTARRQLGVTDSKLVWCLVGLGKALKYDPGHEKEATTLLKEAYNLQKSSLASEVSLLDYLVTISALGCSYDVRDHVQAQEALPILQECKKAQLEVYNMSSTPFHADVLLHLGKALSTLGLLKHARTELMQALNICRERGVHFGFQMKGIEVVRPDMYPDILSSLATLLRQRGKTLKAASLNKEASEWVGKSKAAQRCSHCSRWDMKLLACINCKAPYCSKECQKEDWRLHKANCKKL